MRVDEASSDTRHPDPPQAHDLSFYFNGSLFELSCEKQDDLTLRDALIEFRKQVNIPHWIVLWARYSTSTTPLNEQLKLAAILPNLAGGKYLEVVTDWSATVTMVSKGVRGIETPFDQESGDGGQPGYASQQAAQPYISPITIEEPVYPLGPRGVVLVHRYLLPILRDHIRHDHAATWVNRGLGALLGATITIFLTLCNDSLTELFRSKLTVALAFCLGFLVFLAVIEKYYRARHSGALESMIEHSVKEEHHHG